MTDTALYTNRLWYYLVLDKTILAFTPKRYYQVSVNCNEDFCNKYAYL